MIDIDSHANIGYAADLGKEVIKIIGEAAR